MLAEWPYLPPISTSDRTHVGNSPSMIAETIAVSLERLDAYKALLALPVDARIALRIGHHVTAPRRRQNTRTSLYQQRATSYLMYRDLQREGDL